MKAESITDGDRASLEIPLTPVFLIETVTSINP
jgi:hypothetical protein